MAVPAAERRPRVGGVVPFSTVDYPGRICAVVFLQGCPWRCGYCHNPHLQPVDAPGGGWDAVRTLLARRLGLVDAVVFSGGEPTADGSLEDAIAEVRAAGFAVGLHSAGIHPRRLERVLGLVDWVGLDVKAPFDQYPAVTGVRGSGERARESVNAVIASGREYELRTTFHPGVVTERGVRALAHSLASRGAKDYVLQEFRPQGCMDATLAASAYRPPSPALLEALRGLFPKFTYRRAQ